MASKRTSSSWSDLPSDLLGIVLPRLHSLTDRIRVGAVCRPWRSAARLHYPKLPPPMPWVALGDRAYLDVINASVHELNLDLPPDADCSGSVDHLLFLTRYGGGCFLADPFSGAVHPVPDLAFFLKDLTREEMFSMTFRLSVSVRKVQAHWPAPGSAAAPVVAALIDNTENGRASCRTTIFIFRAVTDTGVGRENYRTMSVDLRRVLDIAFFRGNLYALSMHGQLIAVEIDEEGSSGNPIITNVKYAIKNPRAGSYDNFDYYEEDEIVDSVSYEKLFPTNEAYLVESGDHLLMLKPWIVNNDGPCDNGGFDVYEADLDTIPSQWKPVHNLHGRALFLGGQYGSSSKSIYVGDGYCGAEEDCIYYVRCARDSGIYNLRSGKMMKPLVPDRKVLEGSWMSWTPTWIFPDQSLVRSHYLKKSLD
ncbi:unnamed protein product [Urochloa humidicola]